jgi:hypothetical protein
LPASFLLENNMPNVITSRTILDGSRKTIVKINITGDGSGEESLTKIYDASAFTAADVNNALEAIEYCLNGFSASLFWDATTDLSLISLAADHPGEEDFREIGSLNNSSGTGKTGDILMTTVGLGAGDTGFIILHIKQK